MQRNCTGVVQPGNVEVLYNYTYLELLGLLGKADSAQGILGEEQHCSH